MKITIDKKRGSPLYRQIVEQVRTAVLNGELVPGSAMPTVRALAFELGISSLTVFHAYEELKAQNLLESQPRQGTRIASRISGQVGSAILSRLPEHGPMATYERVSDSTGVRSMATSVGDPKFFHFDEFLAELASLRRESPWNFYYAEPAGTPELLQEIGAMLSRERIEVNESRLLVTNGSMRGIGLVIDALAQPGDSVLVQEPGRLWLSDLLRIKRIVGIPVRNQGQSLDLDHVRQCVALYRPKLMLLTPDFGHGTGLCMPLEDRLSLLDIANKSGALIVEDGSCRMLRFGPPEPPLVSLDQESVFFVGSFSYTLCPGLRTGFLCVPESLRSPIQSVSEATSVSVPKFLQVALARFLARGGLDAHLRRVVPQYRDRRDALLSSLNSHLSDRAEWSVPQGGLSTWVSVSDGTKSSELYSQVIQKGVAFAPGVLFLTTGDPERQFRLSYGMLEPEAIQESVRVLARCF